MDWRALPAALKFLFGDKLDRIRFGSSREIIFDGSELLPVGPLPG